jgi:hypothetical protein
MCAYNIRRTKQVDHDPATGKARMRNLVRELGIVAIGVGLLYFVYWLARRYLF